MSLIRYTVIFLAFVSVFRVLFEVIFDTSVFNFVDEIIFLFCLVILGSLYGFSNKLKLIHVIVLFFVVYSISISLLFGLNNQVVKIAFQTLINIKFFIFIVTFLILFKDRIHFIDKYFKWILYLSVIGLIIHLLLGAQLNEITGVSKFARPHIRYTGFLPHPNHLAYLMVLCVGLILNNRKINNTGLSVTDWLKILAALIIIFLTDSRTSMIAITIFFLGYYWSFIINNGKLFLGSILTILSLFVALYYYTEIFDTILQNIEESLDLSSHYIRGNMIYLSVLILVDFLPIGTGAATFGSVLANDRAYELYGQADRYYFVNEIGVYDSNIASIIGEYGLIGIIIYGLLFRVLRKHLLNLSSNRNIMLNSLILVFLFFSITNPMITNDVYILISIPVFMLFLHSEKNQSLKPLSTN